MLYDNIGILAVPPQIGATNDVDLTTQTPGFLAVAVCRVAVLVLACFPRRTRAMPLRTGFRRNQKWPYSINWNFGVQHSFGKDFTAEVAMWEPGASIWMFRTESTGGRW